MIFGAFVVRSSRVLKVSDDNWAGKKPEVFSCRTAADVDHKVVHGFRAANCCVVP